MTTTADRLTTLQQRAEALGAEAPLRLYHPHMRDGHEQEDWSAFRAELAALTPESPVERGSLLALLPYYPTLPELLEQYVAQRQAARQRAARAAHVAATIEVSDLRGGRFSRPVRIARDAEGAWAAKHPSWLVVERPVERVVGPEDGRDSTSYVGGVRVVPVGTEWPEGTVRRVRMIRRTAEEGRRLQYLVQPRSAAAERRYQQTRRLREVETILGMDSESLAMYPVEQLQALRACSPRTRG